LGADFLKERESFKENKKILLLATLVFFIALSAIFGLLEMKGSINDFNISYAGQGGWLGYVVSWPMLKGFDFWVSFSFCLLSPYFLLF